MFDAYKNIISLPTGDATTMLTLLQGKINGQQMDFVKDADYDTLNIQCVLQTMQWFWSSQLSTALFVYLFSTIVTCTSTKPIDNFVNRI